MTEQAEICRNVPDLQCENVPRKIVDKINEEQCTNEYHIGEYSDRKNYFSLASERIVKKLHFFGKKNIKITFFGGKIANLGVYIEI